MDQHHFLLVVCINSNCIFHLFRDITKFTVYVTAGDLEKALILKKRVETRMLYCVEWTRILAVIKHASYIRTDTNEIEIMQSTFVLVNP